MAAELKRPGPVAASQAPDKFVLAAEEPLKKEELKTLYKFFSVRRFDPELESSQSIETLLSGCDMLIIDVSTKEGLRYYSANVSKLTGCRTIFRAKPGKFVDLEGIKKRFLVDTVIKYLPEEHLERLEFVGRLMNDHISRTFTWLHSFLKKCGCL